MEVNTEIETLIRARYPVLYIVSWEERRVQQCLESVSKVLNRQLFVWSFTAGMKPDVKNPTSEKLRSELEALVQIASFEEPAIFLLKDFHVYLKDPAVLRVLRDLADKLRGKPISICLLAPSLVLPQELEKDLTVIEFPLPSKPEIEAKLNDVIEAMSGNERVDTTLDPADREKLIKAAQGLTIDEIESCLAKSLVQHKRFDISTILDEKKQIIRKSGLLEYYEALSNLDEVGGHELLKEWLIKRKESLTDRARAFGIPTPKGLLLIGVQGCGKSLVAKAVSAAWNLPLIKLDMGRIFGGLVGDSERNMRNALRTAEGVAPCILWLDELEKGLAGSSGGGNGGTSERVLGTFLTWMQEKTKPVFMIATANDVSKLPPELLRKGRFDEIFFIDLPLADERPQIFAIHLKKRKRDPANFDLQAFAAATDGFSGAEIEQVVIAGLLTAFDAGRELSNEDILAECNTQIPLSRMMAEEIDELRTWAKIRTRPSAKAAPKA